MPTPVSVARQCLTDEAARALDDAVAVARRRSHAQTTSLHAVSALLSFPSSALRDACARARSSAYPPKLQFRALDLCVGVSLDRLPTSKSTDDPPVSNSLMAAIKRSQANQRRHPESYQPQQIGNSISSSVMKVEMKYFILSILDDPIVSRVFGEAGFRSCDIKMAIVQPPLAGSSRARTSRFPPIFLCNLTDSDPGQRGFNFSLPFMGSDGNSRRIGEVLLSKNGRNPLLIGACAKDALYSFTESVQKGKPSALGDELAGLSVICIEKEVLEFVVGGGSEEKMASKFEEVGRELGQCSGPGMVVNFGELNGLTGEGTPGGKVSYVVAQLTELVARHSREEGKKLWLMGAAGSYEIYSTFLGSFPNVQKDWDLHLLPITSSNPSFEGVYPKSSLMGSFVPFGGFFSTAPDFGNPLTKTNQSVPRCHLCNENYERDVAAARKLAPTSSVADKYSASLSPYLQTPDLDSGKGPDAGKAKDEATTLDAKILGLQKKWNDICQRVHHSQQFSKLGTPLAISGVSAGEGFQFTMGRKENNIHLPLSLTQCANTSPSITNLQDVLPSKLIIHSTVASEAIDVNIQATVPVEHPKIQQIEIEDPQFPIHCLSNQGLPPDPVSCSSSASVTTDLGLGTIYASASQEPKKSRLKDHENRLQQFSGSVSAEFDAVAENSSTVIGQSFSCLGPVLDDGHDRYDIKTLRRTLSKRVAWQDEAICSISETISRCRTGNGRRCGSGPRGHIWLTFLGPDRIGKRKLASAIAEEMFGSGESLITVDLSCQDRLRDPDSIFDCLRLNDDDVSFRGKTIVDYIAGKLSKKPHSVVLLENIDKADLLVQSSLSQAIKTGKFPDSHGREVSIKNMVFVATSSITKEHGGSLLRREIKVSEEKVLAARNWEMRLSMRSAAENAYRTGGTSVRVTLRYGTSHPLSTNKRKLIDYMGPTSQEKALEVKKRTSEASRSYLDLNLPVEDMEEVQLRDSDSDSMSENSKAWLEEFFEQVDKNVVFKPFDFDAVAEKIIQKIGVVFQEAFGSEVFLEIDQEVMVHILAVTWLSEKSRAVEDWIGNVLGGSFAEAREKIRPCAGEVVALLPCEGIRIKDQGDGVCLPSRIHIN